MVPQELSCDVDETRLHEVLADSRRGEALSILKEAHSPISLADLAREIAEREQERPGVEPDEGSVEQIYLSLYHAHIPKLEDTGLVEFTPGDRTVAPTW